jgi:hypothetical protein
MLFRNRTHPAKKVTVPELILPGQDSKLIREAIVVNRGSGT